MRRALLILAGLLIGANAQAQPVRPMSRAVLAWHARNVSALPLLFQAFPGGPLGSGGSSGSSGPCTLIAAQTPDTYICATNALGNSFIFAEAADSSFDFAHAAATDPTVFIHSHNQSTTQWLGLAHNGTRSIITDGTGVGLILNSGQPAGVGGFVVGAGISRFGSNNAIAWSSTTDATVATDTATRRLAAGVITQTQGAAASIGSLLGGGTNVASADPLPVPTGIVFHVTGTTTFTNITTTNMVTGACFTMIFDGILTATDGGNLKLAGNFVTTADDSLTVCFDGTNYYEVARAVN